MSVKGTCKMKTIAFMGIAAIMALLFGCSTDQQTGTNPNPSLGTESNFPRPPGTPPTPGTWPTSGTTATTR